MEIKIEELIKSFYSEIQRAKSRYELVKIGKPSIEYLVGLQHSPQGVGMILLII